MKFLTTTVLATALCFGVITDSEACSRVTYTSDHGDVVVGRTMDWAKPDAVQLNLFTKGTARSGLGSNPFRWTSKYASLAATSHGFVNSGINEAHLAVDVLYQYYSDYGAVKTKEKTMTSTMLTQFLLDNFASAQEVADFFKNPKFRVIMDKEMATRLGAELRLHYIVTDKSGDNVIIEFVEGKAKVYHQKGRIVLTNEPEYDKMLAIRNYFKQLGIENNMPGSALSEARFVYLTGWLDQLVDTVLPDVQKEVPNYTFDDQAIAMVLSLMRGVSTPFGVMFDTKHMNNTSTLWRTVTDVKNGIFYFDSALKPLTVKVNFNQVDFTKEKAVNLYQEKVQLGDITALFQ